jgi:hypothetical protein
MRRPLPALFSLLLVALLLAACGDSDDDDADTTTTAPPTSSAPATTAAEGGGSPTEDALVDQLVALGFEEGEADCLAGELFAGGIDSNALAELADDPGQALAAVQACDIPLTRILELAQELSGGVTRRTGDPRAAREQGNQQPLGSDAVSEEQARCIADELLAQGRDVTALADLGAVASILEGCGVSLSDLGG